MKESFLISNPSFLAAFSLVVIVFFPSLNNQFVNWDDDIHITQNHFIQPLSIKTVKDIFLSEVNRTYIPLTVLSFAVERQFFGLDPFVYHLDNLLLHIAVVLLVFSLGRLLGLSVFASWLGALIFGIHPMHVESVAWATERKDVLYAVFYMLALVVYARFLKKGIPLLSREGLPTLALMLVFGLLSALSKAMALSLPFILLLLDWKAGRRLTPLVLWEKFLVGMMLVSVVFVTFLGNARDVAFVWPDLFFILDVVPVFLYKEVFGPDVLTVFYFTPRYMPVTTPVVAGSLLFTLALVFLVLSCLG